MQPKLCSRMTWMQYDWIKPTKKKLKPQSNTLRSSIWTIQSTLKKVPRHKSQDQWDIISYEDVKLLLNRYLLALKFLDHVKKEWLSGEKRHSSRDYHHKSNLKHHSQKKKKVIWIIPTWETRFEQNFPECKTKQH